MAMFPGLSNAFNSASRGGMQRTPLPVEPTSGELKEAKLHFFTALTDNNVPLVTRLLKAYPGAIEWRNEENMTGLMVAARVGNAGEIKALLDAGADIHAVNENGSDALMFAAYAGKAIVAQQLMTAGSDVNRANNKGHTPLMSASAHGFSHTLQVLLGQGADSRLKDNDGATALDYAKDNEHQDVVEKLVRRRQIEDERGPVAKAFEESAPRGFDSGAPRTEFIPEPANFNALPPEKKAVYDENTSALRDLEKRMGKAGLFWGYCFERISRIFAPGNILSASATAELARTSSSTCF